MDSRNTFNEAAEQLARTSVGSYKSFMDNTAALQERNVWFALSIIDGSLGELRRQAESSRAISQGFVERADGGQCTLQMLVGESINTYVDLFLAPFHYFREGPRPMASEGVDGRGNGTLPIENYDELTVEEVSEKLGDLSGRDVRAGRYYERRHKNRGELLERLDRALV